MAGVEMNVYYLRKREETDLFGVFVLRGFGGENDDEIQGGEEMNDWETIDTDVPDETSGDLMHSDLLNPVWTFWGHVLFEGEYLEIMTICLRCGNGVTSCTCPEAEDVSNISQEESHQTHRLPGL